MTASLSRTQGRGEIVFRVRTRHAFQSGDVLRKIAELQGVIEARWG